MNKNTGLLQGGSVNSKVDLWIKNWKWRSRSWELPFEFQIHHVQSIRTAQGKPLFERCRRESKWKPRKIRKFDFGSLFEKRWGRFQLFLTEEWSSALERPCVWLSFPSLFGFWDPNLPSRRVNKNEKSPSILVFVKFDHELARTSELDV